MLGADRRACWAIVPSRTRSWNDVLQPSKRIRKVAVVASRTHFAVDLACSILIQARLAQCWRCAAAFARKADGAKQMRIRRSIGAIIACNARRSRLHKASSIAIQPCRTHFTIFKTPAARLAVEISRRTIDWIARSNGAVRPIEAYARQGGCRGQTCSTKIPRIARTTGRSETLTSAKHTRQARHAFFRRTQPRYIAKRSIGTAILSPKLGAVRAKESHRANNRNGHICNTAIAVRIAVPPLRTWLACGKARLTRIRARFARNRRATANGA